MYPTFSEMKEFYYIPEEEKAVNNSIIIIVGGHIIALFLTWMMFLIFLSVEGFQDATYIIAGVYILLSLISMLISCIFMSRSSKIKFKKTIDSRNSHAVLGFVTLASGRVIDISLVIKNPDDLDAEIEKEVKCILKEIKEFEQRDRKSAFKLSNSKKKVKNKQ